MGRKKKIVLILAAVILLLAASLPAAVLYYYTHPSKIKPLLEEAVSRATGTRCTIQELLYSIEERRVGAKGIVLTPGREGEGFHLDIPEVRAEVSLQGPFRRKTLDIRTLRVEGLTLEVSRAFNLPEMKGSGRGPSLLGRVLRAAAALLLFRDVRLETVDLENGRLSGRLGEQVFDIKGLRARVNEDRLLDISCSALFEWPARKSTLTAPALRITTDKGFSLADPRIKGLLEMPDATVEAPEGAVQKMALRVSFDYEHRLKTVRFDSLDARLEGLSLNEAGGVTSVYPRADLQARGLLRLEGFQLEVHDVRVTLGDLLDLNGELMGRLGERPRFDLQGLAGWLVPMKALALLPPPFRKEAAPVALAGRVSLSGGMGGLKGAETWGWHCALKVRLNENPFSYKAGGLRIESRLSGEVQADGPLPRPALALNLTGETISITGLEGVLLQPLEGRISLTGTYPLFDLKEITLRFPHAQFQAGKEAVEIREIAVQGKSGTLDVERRVLSLPRIETRSSLLKNLVLSLDMKEDQTLLGFQGEETGILAAGAALGLSPRGWTFRGRDAVRGRASLRKDGGWAFDASLRFQDLGLENRDSSCIGEKIGLRIEIKGEGGKKNRPLALASSTRVEGGELLYDRFYVDLARTPFFCTWKGEWDRSGDLFELKAFKTGLEGILSLAAEGSLRREGRRNRFRLALSIPDTPLLPPFRSFLLEPYKRENPFLAALEVGGLISADLEAEGDETGWTARGHSRWREGNVSSTGGTFSLQGINLDLPLWYRLSAAGPSRDQGTGETRPPPGPPAKGAPLTGSLNIRSMTLPVIPEQPLSLAFTATPNGLSVPDATKVKVPGGEMEVGPIACRLLPQAVPSAATSISFRDLDLAPLLSLIWSRPVQGSADGRLDPVHLEGHEVRTRGQITVDAFGGEIVVSGLSASGLFTPAPLFRLDAGFRDLNMAELTKETSFGKIEGILEGHLKNLEIAYGQPQRFDLLLETVERKGVPQKISVKAVDNIAQIGGGQSPFMGMAGMLTSFFREFPYEKIGVHATLENDVFHINGTIKDGGKEYIIKRGGFSGVNVVNQNPDNRISFKDMIKRIRRVTESKSGPVVK